MKTGRYRKLQDDLWDSFGATYITLISIIQSALLGFLIFGIQENYKDLTPLQWVISGATFLAIVAIWNEYRMGATMFFWVPTLLDALIPFAFGGFQFLLVRNIIYPDAWFWSIAGFNLLGVLAYENMYRRAKGEFKQNHVLLSLIGKYRWINPISCFVLAVINGFFGWCYNRFPGSAILDTTLATFSLLTFIVFLIRGEFYWARVVKYARKLFNN